MAGFDFSVLLFMLGLDPGDFLPVFAAVVSKPILLRLMIASCAVCGAIELVERRNRELPLHPSRQISISTLLESMTEAVCVLDATGHIVEANKYAEQLTGIPKAQLMKMDQRELAQYVTDQNVRGNASRWLVTRALHGENVREERRRLKLPGGKEMEALVSANPIREPDGRIVGALVIVHDITELSQLQQHMADAEKHNVVGQMTASVAHDFNNVLDTISKAATVLEMSPNRPPDERAVVIRMIQNAVKRGAEIAGNIRKYLRENRIDSESVDLNLLLEDSIELTRPIWQAKKNVSIVRKYEPVPRVRANAAEMRRVFANLIINALDAMPQGGTLVVGGERSGDIVRVFVEDSGEGIPVERQASIFQPYYTTKREGTGLGLSSALKSVRAQSGNLSFTSQPGVGSRFVVELPAMSLGSSKG